MNSREIVVACADYIEEHLQEPLTVEELAAKAGFSVYYFCKMFSLYMGMPVMEYIRRRRLAFAASDICDGKRIIDVAMDYGFESHNGFAKAFKKVYGYSPDEYRRRVGSHRPPAPNPLRGVRVGDRFAPECRIEERSGFYIAGMVLRTSPELSSVAQQPALWKNFQLKEQENRIYAMAMPEEHGEYYISFPVDTDLFRLVAGVRVSDPEGLEDGLYVDWVPPALCGIFSPPPVFGDQTEFADAVVETWKYIYDIWLPQSGYSLDPQGLDYEFYDERCHRDGPYSMDICVPLIKK